MSFILDALKKSERERRQGEVPRLSNEPPAKPRGRPWWPYLIVIALFLNGGMFAWIMLGKDRPVEKSTAGVNPPVGQISSPAVTAGKDALEQVPARTPDPSVARKAETGFPVTARKSRQSPAEATAPPAEEETSPPSAPAGGQNGRGLEERPSRVAAFADGADETEKGSHSEAGTAAEVTRYGALPDGIRETLPALDLQLHFYSRQPERRMVRLNGENLREGGQSGTGLWVVEIVADGVILDFRGTRFLYPAGR